MTPRTRIERPPGFDYLADVRKRFGHIGMVNLAALGTTSTDQRKPYQVVNRVAVVRVSGLLSNDPYWWDETGYKDIQDEVAMAAADSDVDGTLLWANSPGGYTDLCFETADLIAEAGKKKPIWGVADPIAYSACYALLSQVAKMYVPKHTGGVGSIGAYCAHFDYSGYLEQSGIKVTLISEGEGKVDGNPYEKLSERAEADMRTEMARLGGIFRSVVARGRKLTESQVRKLGAYCYEGSQESLGVGLADAAGSAEEALAAFTASLQAGKPSFPSAKAAPLKGVSANLTPQEVSPMRDPNTPEAGTQQPDEAALAAARTAGREEANAETQEIHSLCQLAGQPGLAARFLADKKSPAQVRTELLAAKAAAGDKDEIANGTMPGTSAKPAGTLKERMVQRMKQEGRIERV